MDDKTVKALLELETITIGGVKLIQIPYEDVLRGRISLAINEQEATPEVKQLDLCPEVNPFEQVDENSLVIPVEIMKLYDATESEETMTQEVVDYLKVIAECWGYRNLGFTPSILKKAATHKPVLNRLVLKLYGQKQGDEVLTGLVRSNKDFIQKCWDEQDSAAKN